MTKMDKYLTDVLDHVTSTTDGQTHKQKMLSALHDADIWHEEQIRKAFKTKKEKLAHRRYQQAIWWAIENLDDESIIIRG